MELRMAHAYGAGGACRTPTGPGGRRKPLQFSGLLVNVKRETVDWDSAWEGTGDWEFFSCPVEASTGRGCQALGCGRGQLLVSGGEEAVLEQENG
jgi:hypothetical protein